MPQVVIVKRCVLCDHLHRLDPAIRRCTVDGCNGNLVPKTIPYKQYESEVMNG